MKESMKVGDLVKMNRGYSPPGLVIEISETNLGRWVRVLWPDYCSDHQPTTLERYHNVEVFNESR